MEKDAVASEPERKVLTAKKNKNVVANVPCDIRRVRTEVAE
jgi:hypothetical protein